MSNLNGLLDVMTQIYNFVEENPFEIIIIHVKIDNVDSNNIDLNDLISYFDYDHKPFSIETKVSELIENKQNIVFFFKYLFKGPPSRTRARNSMHKYQRHSVWFEFIGAIISFIVKNIFLHIKFFKQYFHSFH